MMRIIVDKSTENSKLANQIARLVAIVVWLFI